MTMIHRTSRPLCVPTVLTLALSIALAGCQSQGSGPSAAGTPATADIGNPMAAMPDEMPDQMPESTAGGEPTQDAKSEEPTEQTEGAPDAEPVEPTSEPVACGALQPADRAALLLRMNEARAEPRRCGSESYAAAPALVWDSRLEEASRVHSDDMASNGFFSHTGSDGSAHSDRANRAGYTWSTVGENIAAGQRDADVAIAGWLDSPGHCRNLMSSSYRAVGMACVQNASSRYGTYWTQVFAAPR